MLGICVFLTSNVNIFLFKLLTQMARVLNVFVDRCVLNFRHRIFFLRIFHKDFDLTRGELPSRLDIEAMSRDRSHSTAP